MKTPKEESMEVMDYATKWQDLKLWKRALAAGWYKYDLVGRQRIKDALGVFPFEDIKKSLYTLTLECKKLKDRLAIIAIIAEVISPEEQKQLTRFKRQSYETYTTADREDVPSLISLALRVGIDFLEQRVLNNLVQKPQPFDFWTTFANALIENRDQLSVSASYVAPTDLPPVSADSLVQKCLDEATPQWKTVQLETKSSCQASYYGRYGPLRAKFTATVARIVELTGILLKIDFSQACSDLLSDVMTEIDADTSLTSLQKYDLVYSPLISGMLKKAKSCGGDLFTLAPFGKFIQQIIRAYFAAFLSPAKRRLSHPSIREIECSYDSTCDHCKQINTFLRSSGSTSFKFKYSDYVNVKDKDHLRGVLEKVKDICTSGMRAVKRHNLRGLLANQIRA
ncbi:hypothetical protein CC2G_003791 [Coprinopsis cinerea AmutBmut pab1-1]|nr:hypothetical protein CC2G_003791 [Coprinopsis cinerea AmutBmut pab1-1]